MKKEELEFLEEYKKMCVKYRLEISGFDDGAFITELDKEQLDLECLAFDEKIYSDGSVGHSNLGFKKRSDFKNSTTGLHLICRSSKSYKEELEEDAKK